MDFFLKMIGIAAVALFAIAALMATRNSRALGRAETGYPGALRDYSSAYPQDL